MSGIDLFGNDIVEPEEVAPAKRKRLDLFKDFLPDLTQHKVNLLRQDPEAEKDFQAFIINRAMSMHLDCVLYANEVNRRPTMTKQMVYDYYIHSIRKGKRYGWAKKTNVADVKLIMDYYGYNESKALEALRILKPEEIETLRQRMNKGGKT